MENKKLTPIVVQYALGGEEVFDVENSLNGSYSETGYHLLRKNLIPPTGVHCAHLLNSAYTNSENSINAPELALVRKAVEESGVHVFSMPIFTPEGVYVLHDDDFTGINQTFTIEGLEAKLKSKKRYYYQEPYAKGIVYSRDRKITFAPRQTYNFGEHTSKSLERDGLVIATYGISGAKKLAQFAAYLDVRPIIYGFDSQAGKPPQSRFSLLRLSPGKTLEIIGSSEGDERAYAFGMIDKPKKEPAPILPTIKPKDASKTSLRHPITKSPISISPVTLKRSTKL